jgi:hypothetical protein
VFLAGCGSAVKPADQPKKNQPDDFVGIYADDVFFREATYKRETLARQHDAGIRLIRQPFAWAEIEPQPGEFQFKRHDEFVGEAARAGIRVLPELLGPVPGEPAAKRGMNPPRNVGRYARFAAAAVRRWGPDGSYWKENPDVPKLPIHSWQIWNEPNIPAFWASGPDPGEYTALLKAASTAIRETDVNAEVVTGGLPDSHLGLPAPEFLADVYKAGGKDAFDVAAIHPYSSDPAGVLAKTRAIRRVIDQNEDDARIWITEVGWGTDGAPGPLHVTRETQARYLIETFQRLEAERNSLKLRGVVWFQWRDPDPVPGRRPIWPYFAGLVESSGQPKPAQGALERAAKSRLRQTVSSR